MIHRTFIFLFLLAALSACDKTKEPLEGTRQAIFDEMQAPQPEAHRPIILPEAQKNDAWPMAGHNPQHQINPVAPRHQDLGHYQEIWRQSLSHASGREARLINGPIIAQGTVFAIDAAGEVSAFDLKTGEFKWSTPTVESDITQAFGGGLAYEDGLVFATTAAAEVLALKAQDGQILWRSGVSAPVRSAPTVASGVLYVTTINNQLEVFDAQKGEILWRHTGIMESAGILGGSSVALKDGTIIVPYSSGEIFALRKNGAVLWSDSLAALKSVDSVSSLAHIKARPVIYQGKVLVISHSGRTSLHDLRSGVVLWSRDLGGIRSPAVSHDTLFMLSNEGILIALDFETGRVLWSKKLPRTRHLDEKGERIIWAGPVLIGDHLLLGGSHGKMIFCDVHNGAIRHVIDGGSPLLLSPIAAEGTLVWLSDQGELIAYR